MRQYSEIKLQYQDAIVLFRMGDFYETFNEDAKKTAKILGIVLTKRSSGSAADVPLAGFPYHALDNYLPKLVKAGYSVVICEQVEDPKLAKGIVKREVIEVVTPGTLISDQALSQKSNHYLASIYFHRDLVGYAILDQSTGEFYCGECVLADLSEALRKFAPSEVLIGESITYTTTKWYRDLKPFITQVEDWIFNFDQSHRTLTDHFHVSSLKGFGCNNLKNGITAAGVIFYHLKNNLNIAVDHISKIQPIIADGYMGIDGFTMRNLEVFKSLATQGTHGTLIDIIDETVTAGGGRLLRQWLNRPLTDDKKINIRLKSVAGFVDNKQTLSGIIDNLKSTSDIERIIGKVNRRKATPKEILALGNSLNLIPEVIKQLNKTRNAVLKNISSGFTDTKNIVQMIVKTVDKNAPHQIKQGNVIATGIDKKLDELRDLAHGGKKWIAEFQESERKKTGITSLKVGFNRVFGYYIEVTKTHQERVPDSYIRRQTLVGSERYITPELKEYEEKILSAESEIEDIEQRIFNDICDKILMNVQNIQTNAHILNLIDVLSNFAQLAIKNSYCQPVLIKEPTINIEDGRHPVVEKLMPSTERFVPNDLLIDANKNQIQLITGPNMAGKSTYLRQIGLLVLMAQIGSFIPAKSAKIGIVDKLFTRVGASDNLAGGESTFLVEMNEAANILNNATEKSLILLDEIGRGTATYDGMSLAWAIVEYLHNNPKVAARTLFATHYHELTDLEKTLERLENRHTAVEEFGDKIVFLRKVVNGTGDKSYGIHVAKMAGLPEKIIFRATEILNQYLSDDDKRDLRPKQVDTKSQISIFEQREKRLSEALAKLDINSLTPLEALQKIDQLKKKYGL
ncbi:DNA mismatch repair protein MutS [bacterium]|nr:DNA mismatch repair protein MutS [bacterium]